MTPIATTLSDVEHLLELGYADPAEARARELQQRQRLSKVVELADRALADGRLAEAYAGYEAALAEGAADPHVHAKAAQALFREGRLAAALTHLDHAMHHGLESSPVATLRGAVLLSMRALDEAVDQLEYARRLRPRQPGVDRLLGAACGRLRRDEQAIEAYGREIAADPSCWRTHLGLAELHARAGRLSEAAGHALSAVDNHPRQWRCHYQLGVCLELMGRVADARLAFDAAGKLEPSAAAPHWRLERLAGPGTPEAAAHRAAWKERVAQRRRQAGRADAVST